MVGDWESGFGYWDLGLGLRIRTGDSDWEFGFGIGRFGWAIGLLVGLGWGIGEWD